MLSFHVQFLADEVMRHCGNPLSLSQTSQDKEFKALQDHLAGRTVKQIVYHYCNDTNLCNGSGRLAEISTMKILLPASLVLLISFFSRL
jgi:hypothetical protein